MLAITVTSPIVSAAPSAPVGRLLAGDASADLKHSSFTPTEQASQTPRVVNERDRDDRPTADRQREQLNGQLRDGRLPTAVDAVVHAASAAVAPNLPPKNARVAAGAAGELTAPVEQEAADDVQSIQAQLDYRSRLTGAIDGAPSDARGVAAQQSSAGDSVQTAQSNALIDDASPVSRELPGVAALMERLEAREALERDEKGRAARAEIMELVSERSIRLNQRLLEVALAHNELDVGAAINRHV